jgi:signal transduction histidine kinase
MRVLVLAPRGRDRAVIAASLREAGIDSADCADMACVCEHIRDGAAALLVAQEGLTPDAQRILIHCLSAQPRWSALPIVLLTLPELGTARLAAFLAALGPVGTAITVERPIKPATFQSILRMVLLTRQRQYQLRGHLAEIERQQDEISRHRDNLQQLVQQRTAELRDSMRKAQDAQRLAALGNMAAGIGHDIANMTLPIRARLDPLAAACGSPEARDDVAAIGKSLAHLTSLSAGLRLMALDPSRDSASGPPADLAKWSEEADAVLRNALPRSVRLEWDVPPDGSVPGVDIPSHRLTQVIFNLVQNAGEAIASETRLPGIVRISARALARRDGLVADRVEIAVADNGPGIAPDHLARIFEPYFTTKGRAIATGMGLGMVRGLVESAGGSVRVESSPGAGATFILTLPVLRPPAAPSIDAPPITAAVTLADARQHALAEAILRGLNISVLPRSRGSQLAPAADVWITSPRSSDDLATFLAADAGRRLVVVGDGPRSGPPPGGAHERLVHVPRSAGPAALRDTLVSVIRACAQPVRERVP